jgi:ABC-type xylose transport system substrate-binding protein
LEVSILNVVICVDFDGTCVTNEYPEIGKDVPNCIEVLKKLNEKKVNIILLTQRDGKKLTDAVEWFKKNDIKLYGINDNPSQSSWSKSRKVYADLYIDDRNLGCPITLHRSLSDKVFVDWKKVEKILKEMRVL